LGGLALKEKKLQATGCIIPQKNNFFICKKQNERRRCTAVIVLGLGVWKAAFYMESAFHSVKIPGILTGVRARHSTPVLHFTRRKAVA